MEGAMFEVGDRIIRKHSGLPGSVQSMRKTRVWMVEVKWDATGLTQWLPSEEFRPWDVSDPAPAPKLTSWGRTTPEYIHHIRSSKQCADERKARQEKPSKIRLEAIADQLCGLNPKKKQRNNNKVKKISAQLAKHKGLMPAWHYAQDDVQKERISMKKLYQEKSGDYSY